MSPLDGGYAAAGVQSHGDHSFTRMHLHADHNLSKIGSRGHGSPSNPHVRASFRFSSPNACSGQKRVPGTTSAVPRSPRAASALDSNITAHSDAEGGRSEHWKSHRGLSPGKVVEAYRNKKGKLAWPLRPGNATTSPAASPRGESPRGLRSPRCSVVEDAASPAVDVDGTGSHDSADDGPLSPRAAQRDVQRQLHMQQSIPQEPMFSSSDVMALAAAASAEAEAHAEHHGEDAVFLRKPALSPKRRVDPRGEHHDEANSPTAHWRVGLTQRTSELGARRLFPTHLVQPHALANAAKDVEGRDAKDQSCGGAVGSRAPPPAANKPVAGKPNKAASKSDASLKRPGISIGFGRGTSAFKEASSPRSPQRSFGPPSVEAASQRFEVSAISAVEESSLMAAAQSMQVSDRDAAAQRPEVSVAANGAAPGSAAKRLQALRGKLERSLRSAEDNHMELQQAEQSLIQRRNFGTSAVAA